MFGRSFAHWTPRYVLDRVTYMVYEKTYGAKAPWLTREANSCLEQLLRREDLGIEWGAGRSTPWIAARIRHLTSVESDLEWGERVRAMIGPDLTSQVTLVVCPDATQDPIASRYVRILDEFADGALNFALVDGGVARDHCALGVIPKLAPGAILVLDNAQWYLDHPSRAANRRTGKGPANEYWADFEARVRAWRCIWTTTSLGDTAIWFRP
jgi:predicted O-methyltransferase YrrM